MATNRPLRVFLCHSSADKPAVRELYQKLRAEPWIEPWLDEEELYPGQDWNMEIEKAIEATDVILVCLSNSSITKEGYIQREIRIALDYADYKPEGTLFIIPARLEECTPPKRLARWQYVDYFENQQERALDRLLASLKIQAKSLDTKGESQLNSEGKSETEKPELEYVPNTEVLGTVLSKKESVVNPKIEFLQHPTQEWIEINKIILPNGMEFMRIPAGKFLMGSENGESAEKPQHVVDIPYDYWMARFPLINTYYNDYLAFLEKKKRFKLKDVMTRLFPIMERRPVQHLTEREIISDIPVVNVSWQDARAYCDWLSNLLEDELPSNLVLRLPTEAEWEKAARGTDGREYPWGDEFNEMLCNTKESNIKTVTRVGGYKTFDYPHPLPYGCAGMIGNVWEWTCSMLKPYPYNINDDREPQLSSSDRIVRGGSFNTDERNARITYRLSVPAKNSSNSMGFRICLAPSLLK